MKTAPALMRVVFALGITQIIAWGSLYYTVTVLAAPMAVGLGCDSSWIFAGFSAALMASGLAAPAAGRAIDRLGGRAVLARARCWPAPICCCSQQPHPFLGCSPAGC